MTLQEKSFECVKNPSANVHEWLARQNSSQSRETMSLENRSARSGLRSEGAPNFDRKLGVANISRLPAVSASALYELAQSTRQARLRYEQQFQENQQLPPQPRTTSVFPSPDAAAVDIVNPFDRRPRQDDGGRAEMLRAAFAARRAAQQETSFTSQTSSDSRAPIDDLLGLRESDPEELLLSLGFGGPLNSPSRIPPRFLGPSAVRGVDIQTFLGREQERLETFESGAFGYRGLQGPSHRRPSQIVANIIDRIKEQERSRKQMTLIQQNGWGLVARRLNSSSHWSSYEENDKPVIRTRPSTVAEDPVIPFPDVDVNANISETQESPQKRDIAHQTKDSAPLVQSDNVTEDPSASLMLAQPTTHEMPPRLENRRPENLTVSSKSASVPATIDTITLDERIQNNNGIALAIESEAPTGTASSSQVASSTTSPIDESASNTCATHIQCVAHLVKPVSQPACPIGASCVKDNVANAEEFVSDVEENEDPATGFAAFVKSYDEGGDWDDEEVESFSKVILREDWEREQQHTPLREDKAVETDFSYMETRACESALIWLLSHALKMYRKGRSTRFSTNKTLNALREQATNALKQAEMTLAALKDLPPTGSSDNLQKCLHEVLLLLEEQETLQEQLAKGEEEEIQEENKYEGENLDPLWLQTLEKRLLRQIRVSVRKSVTSALRRQRRRKVHSGRRVRCAPIRQVINPSAQNEESEAENFEEISAVPTVVTEQYITGNSKISAQETDSVLDENDMNPNHSVGITNGEPHSLTAHSSCDSSPAGVGTSTNTCKSKSRWVNRARVVGKFSRWLKTVTENGKSSSQERRFQF